MHLVIYDVSSLPEVDRVDDFIVAILFISIQILCLASVSRVMEEEGIIRPGILHEPVHGP